MYPIKNLKNSFRFLIICNLTSFLFSQINTPNQSLVFEKYLKANNSNQFEISSGFNFIYNSQFILNNGHPNIDNNSEIYSIGYFSKFNSTVFKYSNSWLMLEIEPYSLTHSKIFNSKAINSTQMVVNNHLNNKSHSEKESGFRHSRIIIHYNGLGVSYGKRSHWWGPGFHSAIALSSNAPSQATYAIGSFKDLRIGKFGFGAQIIAMPYNSLSDVNIYFSGLKSNITYYSNPIIRIGMHRTYLSGDFANLDQITNSTSRWTIEDAALLVIEPLFGQSKKDLAYTSPGTPGFDLWDEILTGYVKIIFPNSNLELYADIASDDNRANITDLRAHWDHTLAYQLGLTKKINYGEINYFLGVEYLTTRVSNTFNPNFYRGNPNTPSYYFKGEYDYFSFKGRRMGAHSGSSSDDFIFLLGMSFNKSLFTGYWNLERHALKTEKFPEIKSELNFMYQYRLSKIPISYFIAYEYEKINNYEYIQQKLSTSSLFWFGFSINIK